MDAGARHCQPAGGGVVENEGGLMVRTGKNPIAVLAVFLLVGLPAISIAAECYTQTVSFDPDEGYIWNVPWEQCLPGIPFDCQVESAEIEVRTQVWYWGYYPYEQDILTSNTTSFNYSEGYVCSLTTATHPNASNFYTVHCSLDNAQTDWILDNGCSNFMMVTFGGTYYMDNARLTVCCGDAGPPEIGAISYDSCVIENTSAGIEVAATDPAGGNLNYSWEALDGGTILGTGDTVTFEPPGPSISPACEPFRVRLTATSDASGLSAEETVGIVVKLAGDVTNDGGVNILDKVAVRDAFGQGGNPGWIAADVNVDGVVNILDKVIVRDEFGQSGCVCP